MNLGGFLIWEARCYASAGAGGRVCRRLLASARAGTNAPNLILTPAVKQIMGTTMIVECPAGHGVAAVDLTELRRLRGTGARGKPLVVRVHA